jgi:hypothetical protein
MKSSSISKFRVGTEPHPYKNEINFINGIIYPLYKKFSRNFPALASKRALVTLL